MWGELTQHDTSGGGDMFRLGKALQRSHWDLVPEANADAENDLRANITGL